MKKLWLICGFNLIYFFTFITSGFACVGARPMAMGGAFIGVADDASATYWNPAGLDQKVTEKEKNLEEDTGNLQGIEVTYTPTLHNRDEYNYDDFVAINLPLQIKDFDLGNVGLSYINSGFEILFWDNSVSTFSFDRDESWIWLSYGKHIFAGLSAGVNVRYHGVEEEYDLDIHGVGSLVATDDDSYFALDASLFYKIGRLSFGVLYQDANEPEEELWGIKTSFVKNMRPGIAFRPDDDTVIAVDMYDAAEETEDSALSVARDIRVGLERWFDLPEATPRWVGERFALRLGGYHINNRDMRAYTFGLGIKGSDWQEDEEEAWFKSGEIDYTVFYWDDSSDFTHFLGITFSF